MLNLAFQGCLRERVNPIINFQDVWQLDEWLTPGNNNCRYNKNFGPTRMSQSLGVDNDTGGFPERSTQPVVGSSIVRRRYRHQSSGCKSVQLWQKPPLGRNKLLARRDKLSLVVVRLFPTSFAWLLVAASGNVYEYTLWHGYPQVTIPPRCVFRVGHL